MATKSKAKLASTKPVSTKWLQNAMRSIGVSTKNVLKSEFAPNLYEAVETGINTSKTVIGSLRRNAGGANQISQQIQSNKYVKFAQTAYKNALSDLRSGNLNNDDRFSDSLFGDSGDGDFDSLFGDSGFSFGDDGADELNVNIVNASGNNDAMFAMTTHLQKQTEATLKTSQANMNAMIAVNSASMMQTQQIGSAIVSGLDAINKNLSSLIEYNNSNMNKFIESSLAFYERMGTKFDNGSTSSSNPQKINASQVLNSASGGINFSQYKQYIQQQMKDSFKGSNAGMLASLIDDQMLQMAASNPLGFATEGLIKFMIPKMLTNTIKGVEETYSSFMPALLHKLSKWGEGTADGMLGKAKQLIGKTFGLKMDRVTKLDKSAHIEKGAIPFDGQTKHAITEIITKELREQTSYLKAIAEHYGIDTNRARKNADVFNYRTGNYTSVDQITTSILTEIKDSILGSLNSSTVAKTLRSADIKDKHRDAYNHTIDEFLLRLEKQGPDIKIDESSLTDKSSAFNSILESLSADKRFKTVITDTFRDLIKNNPNAILGLTPAILRAQSARNSTISDIQNNPTDYNLYATQDFTGSNIDEMLFKMMNAQGKSKLSSKRGKIGTAYTTSVDTGSRGGTINQLLSTTGHGISQLALGIINGSSNAAVSSFTNMLGEQFSVLWGKFDETFLTPIKNSMFGTRDEDNYSRDGIFSGVINGFKDAAGHISQYISGKSFKDSHGNIHDIKEDDTSVVGNLKKIGSQVKSGIMEHLFGKEKLDKDGNPTGFRDKAQGILSGFTNTLREGLNGWRDALFGKPATEKDKEELQKSITKKVSETMPNAITGSAIGAGVGMVTGGGLLGTLVGGPIGGAIMGTVVGIASKSEKFQNWLFGEKDENGNRVGGFISKKVQDYTKENKNALVGSAAVGAVTGTITGGGILGSLIGGPVAGALLGLGTSIIKRSKTFQEFLHGDEKTGQRGIIDIWNQVMGKTDKSDNSAFDKNGKALGMGILGTGAGALTGAIISKMGILGASLSPLGPVGGALLGLGLSIRAQKDNFHKWLFGEKDENGNKTKEGVIGQFGNMLKVSLLSPLKTGVSHLMEDAMFTLRTGILDNIRFAFEPIAIKIKSFSDKIKDRLGNIFNKVGEAFKTTIIDKIDDFIITPFRNVIGGIGKIVWGSTKKLITAPFKILANGAKLLNNKIGTTMHKLTTKLFDFITKPFKKLFGGIFKAVGGLTNLLIKKPLSFIGGVTNYLGDKIYGVGKDDKDIPDADGKATNSKDERKLRKEQNKIEKQNMLKRWREDNIRTRNQQMIAKATGYQFTEDTEENRRKAEAALNKKINWRIDASEDARKKSTGASTVGMDEADTVNANFSELSDEAKQTNVLLKIFDLLQGKLGKKKSSFGSEDKPDTGSGTTTTADNDEPVASDTGAKISDSLRIQQEIEDAGGLKNYLAAKAAGAREKVSTIFSTSKAWVGSKVSRISNLLGRFKGKGHADGTDDTGDEAAVVGENGPELVNFSKGNKVFANSKPLAVYIVGGTLGGSPTATRKLRIKKSALSGLGIGSSSSSDGALIDGNNSAIEKGYTSDEKLEAIANAKNEEKQSAMVEGIQAIAEGQKEHNFKWSSIFSKKGLITGLVIAAVPLLLKLFKNFGSIGEFIQNISTSLGWSSDSAKFVKKNGGLGDGDTTLDKVSENVDRFTGIFSKDKNFVLNEDGQWDHQSAANAQLAPKIVGNMASNALYKGGKAVGDFAKSKAGGAILDAASSKVANAGTKLATSGGSKLLKTVTSSITSFFDDVIKKVAKKFGKEIGESVLSSLLSKLGGVLAKYFGKITAKISAIIARDSAVAASNAAMGAGVVIKAGMIAISAINGASGTARLFRVDQEHVDGWMTAIATAFGAASGTMIGSIIDVVNELFCSITGIDLLTEAATLLYNVIAGDTKADKLRKGREEFEQQYLKYQDAELSKQYDTMTKAGLIDSSVSYDDYVKGVKDGKYEAKYDSFADYNDKQHKTLGAKLGGAIAKGAKTVGKDVANLWTSAFGKKTKYLVDANGNQYHKNGDGTYQVIGANGEDLGYISKEALPDGLEERSEKEKGSIKKFAKASFDLLKHTTPMGIKNAIMQKMVNKTKTRDVMYAADGSYYTKDGRHYSSDGTLIEKISKTELSQIDGLTSGTAEVKSRLGENLSNMGANLKDFISNGFTKIGGIFSNIKDNIVDAGKAFTGGLKAIFKNWNSGDMSFSDYMKADVTDLDKDNPLAGMVNGVLNVGKIVMIPKMIMSQVGHKIWDGMKAIGKGIATIATTTGSEYIKIKKMALKGDISGLNNYKANFDTDVPLSGFFETIVNMGKYTQYPLAGISWVGHKVWDGMKAIGNGVKNVVTSVGPEMLKIKKMAFKGDISGLNEYRADFDTNVPLSGFFETIVNMGKYTQYPLAGISWVGHKVWDGMKAIGNGVKNVVTSVTPEMLKIKKMAFKGDISGLNDYKANFDTNVPLSGFFETIVNVGKYTQYPLAGISWVGKTIKDSIIKLGGNIKTAWSSLTTETDKIDKFASDGDFASINAYKPNVSDDTPLSGIINASLHVVKTFSYIKTTFHWLGNKLKSIFNGDFWNGIGETVGGWLTKFKNWISTDSGNGAGSGQGGRGVPYYSQNDTSWATRMYGTDGSTMGDSGCGPTAMAMVASDITNKKITPITMANLSEMIGTRDASGTNAKFIDAASKAYGFGSSKMPYPSANGLYNAASRGPVILLGQDVDGGQNPFTKSGHFVVADGVDGAGNIKIKDPRGSAYNRKYSAKNLANTTSTAWGFRKRSAGGRGSISDLFSSISGFMGEFGNRAWAGLSSGNWNSDYSDYFASDSSASSATIDTSSSGTISGSNSAQMIWNYFKSHGLSDNTIAGIMANLRAESGLNPTNLQNSYESKLGFTDASYTAAVDSGKYNNFVHDKAGYGLVQWTYWSLKQALLNYAKSKGKSIGDMNMQLDFLVKQLSEDYPSTWAKMTSASSPEEASTIMLKEFERPAVLNTNARAGYAKQYYDLYAGKGGRGNGAYIKPRIVKTGIINNMRGGRGPVINTANNWSGGATADYQTARSATKYIDSLNGSNMANAINMIITLLEAITGNTALASSKLDLLQNIKGSNVVVGGNTHNYISNGPSNPTNSNNQIVNTGSGKTASRNQKIAEKIASGM